MKLSLSIIVGLLLLAGCGPAWKLKRAQKLINSAIENGAKVDSLTKIVHDTIHTKEVVKEIQIMREIDTVLVLEKCKEIIKNPNKTNMNNLKKEICPDTTITETFPLEIMVQGKTYKVPVRMSVMSRNGLLGGKLQIDRVEIPFESERTTVGISSGYTMWGLIWRIIVIGFIPGFAACWLLKLFKVIP